jgi:hypothetical protein
MSGAISIEWERALNPRAVKDTVERSRRGPPRVRPPLGAQNRDPG